MAQDDGLRKNLFLEIVNQTAQRQRSGIKSSNRESSCCRLFVRLRNPSLQRRHSCIAFPSMVRLRWSPHRENSFHLQQHILAAHQVEPLWFLLPCSFHFQKIQGRSARVSRPRRRRFQQMMDLCLVGQGNDSKSPHRYNGGDFSRCRWWPWSQKLHSHRGSWLRSRIVERKPPNRLAELVRRSQAAQRIRWEPSPSVVT